MRQQALVIEDDHTYRTVLELLLGGLGFSTHAAGDAASGLAKAQALRPSLIVTGSDLPDAEGYELCRSVREDPDIGRTPVLMITGTYLRGEARRRARAEGADAYIEKPVRLWDLRAALERLEVAEAFAGDVLDPVGDVGGQLLAQVGDVRVDHVVDGDGVPEMG